MCYLVVMSAGIRERGRETERDRERERARERLRERERERERERDITVALVMLGSTVPDKSPKQDLSFSF